MATLVPPDPRDAPQSPDEAINKPTQTPQHRPDGSFAPGNTLGPGRPPGLPNKPIRALREILRAMTMGNPLVVARLRAECETGKIDQATFRELLHYAYGKPPDKLVVEDQRAPFAVLLRKQVEILHEERTLAGPLDEGQPEEPPPPELKALPPGPVKPVRRPRVAAPEPEEDNGGGVIWGD